MFFSEKNKMKAIVILLFGLVLLSTAAEDGKEGIFLLGSGNSAPHSNSELAVPDKSNQARDDDSEDQHGIFLLGGGYINSHPSNSLQTWNRNTEQAIDASLQFEYDFEHHQEREADFLLGGGYVSWNASTPSKAAVNVPDSRQAFEEQFEQRQGTGADFILGRGYISSQSPLLEQVVQDNQTGTVNSQVRGASLLHKIVYNNYLALMTVFRGGNLGAVAREDSNDIHHNLEAEHEHFEGLVEDNLLLSSQAASSNGMLGADTPSQECLDDYALTMSKFNISNLKSSELWALYMLDSWGKLPSDILGGNNKWLGNIDECHRVKAVVNKTQLFTGKYCRARLGLGPFANLFKNFGVSSAELGVCFSSRCSMHDVLQIMKEEFKNQGSELSVNRVVCLEDRELKSDAVTVIIILSCLGLLVLSGTLYDVTVVQLKLFNNPAKKGYSPLDSPPPYESSNDKLMTSQMSQSYDKTYESTDIDKLSARMNSYGTIKEPVSVKRVGFTVVTNDATKDKEKEPQKGLLAQILLSFSVYTNGCKLVSATQSAGSLGAVNGIRFLSMAWVILGHTFIYATAYCKNMAGASVFYERLSFSAILYATFSVDSFFVLSGLLVAYLTFKELEKAGGVTKLNWGMFYFHRFWRLTPPYMLVLMVATVLWPYFSQGALFMNPNEDTHPQMKWCRDNWWVNLLYVNNYVRTNETCMGHAWYLANDMQYYVVSPLIMVPMFYHVIAGGLSSTVFLLGTVITTAVVVYKHEYPAQSGPGVPAGLDNRKFQNTYIPSYTRMGPYIAGLLTGYLLYRLKCKCKIPLVVNLCLWAVSFCICVTVVYVPFTDSGNHIFSNLDSAMYTALSRTAWGVALSWIIFACGTGNGGWINQLLSWSPFIPLGRLTYCAYLVHPIIEILYFENREDALYFSNYNLIYMFLGHMTLTYAVAFVISLFFESPMMGLEKALLRENQYLGKAWSSVRERVKVKKKATSK